MPRDLPLGNGSLLVNFDHEYHLRDFYFPRVGGENHTSGHPFRFGVWTDGQFGWVHDDDWQRSLLYADDTLVTDVTLRCERMGLVLECADAVDFHETAYLRRVRVRNLADHAREVRLFFSQDFHISDYDVGDTAYYQPRLNAIIHYKGPRYFLVNARTDTGAGISEYATGLKDMPGREGTWRDAEGDGELSKNAIAQGSVDSTVGVSVQVEAGGEATVYYWIAASESYRGVEQINDVVLDKQPETLLRRTGDYWRLWANKDDLDLDDLPQPVVRLYRRSLLTIRTQMDNNGAILAANDTDVVQFNRDTYSYVWPRDGALAAHALAAAGYESLSLRFFDFCKPLITRDGYFLHKYNPDGSAGSSWQPWFRDGHPQLPIQEDETALVVWALWKHFDKFRDVEDIKPLYRDLIIRAGNFLAGFMDEAHGLPLPSYDLWEERWGVHAWTVGAVYGGLLAARNFARAFGETEEADRLQHAADRIRDGVDRLLWSEERQRFVRTVTFGPDGAAKEMEQDGTLDTSMAGLMFFGMYGPEDPRIAQTAKALYDRLWVKTQVGGMARYEDDYYHQVSHDLANVPGNPWFVCTLWIAQYWIARADTEEELTQALPALEWVCAHALPSGILAEQVDPYTGAPLSVSPLTWSHAAFVTAVVEYLDRKSALSVCPTCGQPRYSKEQRRLAMEREHTRL